MCPSYMVTREEKHSTRGRARLLFEMMNGEVLTGGWRSEAVQRGARPVPGVQGLQARLPGERGHGHVQGRVPVPLLRGAAAAAPRLRVRLHPRLGAGRGGHAAARQLRDPRAGTDRAPPSGRRAWRPDGGCRRSRRSRSSAGSGGHRPPDRAGPRVVLWAGHLQRLLPSRDGTGGGRVLECAGFRGRRARAADRAAAGRSTTSASSAWPGAGSAASFTRCVRRSRRVCRSWCSSRAARPCSATR